MGDTPLLLAILEFVCRQRYFGLETALTGILAERGVSISPLSVPGCRLALCEISNQLQSPDPSLEELANCLTALSEYVSAHLPDQTIPTKALLRRLTALKVVTPFANGANLTVAALEEFAASEAEIRSESASVGPDARLDEALLAGLGSVTSLMTSNPRWRDAFQRTENSDALNTRALITGAMRRLTETYSWESIVADTTILCDSVEKSFPPQTELMVLFESRGQPPPVVVPGASGGADDSKSTSLISSILKSSFQSDVLREALNVLQTVESLRMGVPAARIPPPAGVPAQAKKAIPAPAVTDPVSAPAPVPLTVPSQPSAPTAPSTSEPALASGAAPPLPSRAPGPRAPTSSGPSAPSVASPAPAPSVPSAAPPAPSAAPAPPVAPTVSPSGPPAPPAPAPAPSASPSTPSKHQKGPTGAKTPSQTGEEATAAGHFDEWSAFLGVSREKVRQYAGLASAVGAGDAAPVTPSPGELVLATTSHGSPVSTKKAPKRPLLEKQPNAVQETFDEVEDGSGASSDTVPMVKPVSAPEVTSAKGTAQKRTPFTLDEEVTLRKGVQRFGVGNWKAILAAYPAVFKGRTTVNLKDKWRNMTKD